MSLRHPVQGVQYITTRRECPTGSADQYIYIYIHTYELENFAHNFVKNGAVRHELIGCSSRTHWLFVTNLLAIISGENAKGSEILKIHICVLIYKY